MSLSLGMGLAIGMDDEAGSGEGPVVLSQSIFDPATQTGMAGGGDATVLTCAVLFRSLVSGYATHVRFWKSAADVATTRNVGIYDLLGTNLIASGTSVGEPAGPAWITVALTAPVRIEPTRVYVSAVHFPSGQYGAQVGGFTSAVTRGYITALADNDPAAAAGNGRYVVGPALAFPTENFGSPNYWIDVVVAIPEWVDASSTGYAPGSVLTPYAGQMSVTTNDTVVQNTRITGNVVITASNVTFRNCEIIADTLYHTVFITSPYTGTKFVDCTITGNMGAQNGIVGAGTFIRCDLSGFENAISPNGAADIYDCYMHNFGYTPGVDPHYDGIQNDGSSNSKYIHNTIILNQNQTAAIMNDNFFAGLDNIEIAYNYITGGTYPLYVDASKSDTFVVVPGNINIHHNRVGIGQFGYFAFNPGIWGSPTPHDNYDAITGLPID